MTFENRRWWWWCSCLLLSLCTALPVLAQQQGPSSVSELLKQFPVDKKDGHISSVTASVTPLIGKPRPVVLLGISDFDRPSSLYTHVIRARSTDGGSEVSFWFDSIQQIKDVSTEDFLVVLKEGNSRKVRWTGAGCSGEPSWAWTCAFIAVANLDGTREIIDLRKIRSLDFSESASVAANVPRSVSNLSTPISVATPTIPASSTRGLPSVSSHDEATAWYLKIGGYVTRGLLTYEETPRNDVPVVVARDVMLWVTPEGVRFTTANTPSPWYDLGISCQNIQGVALADDRAQITYLGNDTSMTRKADGSWAKMDSSAQVKFGPTSGTAKDVIDFIAMICPDGPNAAAYDRTKPLYITPKNP